MTEGSILKRILLIALVLVSHVFAQNNEEVENVDLISNLADSNLIRSSDFNLRQYIKHLKIIVSKERIIHQLIESIDTNYRVNYFKLKSMLSSSYELKQYFFGCELVQCLEGIIASDSAGLRGFEQIINQYNGLNDGMIDSIVNYYSLKNEAQLRRDKSNHEFYLQFFNKLSEPGKVLITYIDKYLNNKYFIHTGAYSELEYSDLIELKSIYYKWWQANRHKTIKEINVNLKQKGSPLTKTKYYQFFYQANK